jgi:hypothetical protein
MKPLALLGLTLTLTACGPDTTALDVFDGSAGGGGGEAGGGGGGTGGAVRGRRDGSIEDTGGSGGSGTGGSGTGGSTGGSGGSGDGGSGGGIGPDAGLPSKDALPPGDAASQCDVCAGYVKEYADAIKQEQVCNPNVPNQCLKQTQGSLSCGCSVWVTNTFASDAVRKRFADAGCIKCQRFSVCPAIACVAPGTGVCTPVSAASDPAPPGSRPAPIVAPPPQGQCMTKY